MRSIKLFKVTAIMLLNVILLTTIIQFPVKGLQSDVIPYEEDGVYIDIPINAISVNEQYYGMALVQYEDLTYSYVLMSSLDGVNWQFVSVITERNEAKPEAFTLRYLNDIFIVSLSHRNGQVRYISNDGQLWETNILYYQDIIFQDTKYWAVDLKGRVFSSEDIKVWKPFIDLQSSSTNELLAINLSVNPDVVVVSHYAPKWGSTNYLNGLETYIIQGNIWQPSIGYNGLIGTTLDIVNTEKGFILAYQNDYSYQEPILFYRSKDGVNWSLETNLSSLIRDLNPIIKKDSNINVLIEVLNRQISEEVALGNPIPVQVALDNQVVEFDQDALLISGRVYVPVRKIFELFNGSVEFDQVTQTVTGKVDRTTISLKIGENSALVNGNQVPLDAPALIINDRTLVPARFIAECLGKEVVWDQNNYIVYLN